MTLDPWVPLPLALLLAVFLTGRVRLANRSKTAPRTPWLFLAGLTVLTLADKKTKVSATFVIK